MSTDIEERLSPYLFPVDERPVFFERDTRNGTLVPSPNYKAIVRKDNGNLIAIQRDTYKLVPNSEVIKPLLEQLHQLDTSLYLDPSHSFVDDDRMRLQVTFPELLFHDGRSEIALSLFLHNSYDSSEGVRLFWGAIRAICKNGMVFGIVLAKYYRKHTQNLEISNLRDQLESTYDKIPVIRDRIDQLQATRVTKDFRVEVIESLGKKIGKYIEDQEETRRLANQWALYNVITYFVSHLVKQKMRASYQRQVSNLFGL